MILNEKGEANSLPNLFPLSVLLTNECRFKPAVVGLEYE